MATFVLIHGSWHGGWCFDPIRPLLETAGHHVIAPDLPGMNGDEATLRAVTLDGWAEFAVEQCRAAHAGPVILAGHSRGGVVVSAAAEHDPAAMDALVYICAMMLPDGMSRQQLRDHQPANPAYDAMIESVANGAGTRIIPGRGADVFAQLSPPDAVAAAMGRLVTEPTAPRATPMHLTPGRFGTLPRTYIECTEDRTIAIDTQRLMQRLVPGADVVTLDADHSPFLSRPHELAAALLAVAAEAERCVSP